MAASKVTKSVEVDMNFTKTTKNFDRFDSASDDAAIQNTYIKKGTIGDVGPGTVITITAQVKEPKK